MALNNYHEKQEQKKEHCENQIEKNNKISDERYKNAKKLGDCIPFGQPILVGHHSEKRHRKHLESINTNYEKSFEAKNKADHYQNRLDNMENNNSISSDDPGAVKKLKEKVETLEKQQTRMKETNRIIRKKPKNKITDEKKASLKALNYDESSMYVLFTPDCFNSFGFASYELTNLNNKIKTAKGRLKSIESTRNLESKVEDYETFSLNYNTEANRVQFTFDGKPSDEIRTILKSNAFKWAPSTKTWQRFLNNGGIYAAQSVVDKLKDL